MSGYRWVEVKEACLFHDACIRETGGSQGIRDDKLLESALGKPKNLAAYESPGLYELAASYAEGIARNHPFVDGNKRTALIVAGRFLDNHGIELVPERGNELTEMVEGLAQGTVSRRAFADHLRVFSREIEPAIDHEKPPLEQPLTRGRER